MIYPFLTLDDDTEIVHTEILKDGSVKVRAETPVFRDSEKLIMHFAAHGGFENASPFQKLRQKELLRRGKSILAK